MKKRRHTNHFAREAWLMALLLPAIVVIGAAAGVIVQSWHRWFGSPPAP
ncbi:MAG: hypothetical protein ABI843_08515 [Dokdonella sp.]